MLDTNVLISALVFRSKPMNEIIKRLEDKYSLVLCSHIIDELHEVIREKFANKSNDLERFLLELPFEYVYTPQIMPQHDLFAISDADDEKVLYSAILADVDVLVSGDSDYDEVDIERPEILKPAEFIEKY
jgi:putative PIN family toxin of toxin-antitoxin system